MSSSRGFHQARVTLLSSALGSSLDSPVIRPSPGISSPRATSSICSCLPLPAVVHHHLLWQLHHRASSFFAWFPGPWGKVERAYTRVGLITCRPQVLLFGFRKAATVTPQSWLYDMFMPLGILGFTSMNLTVLLTTVMLEYLTC